MKISFLGHSVLNKHWAKELALDINNTVTAMSEQNDDLHIRPHFYHCTYPLKKLHFPLKDHIEKKIVESYGLLHASKSDLVIVYEDDSSSAFKTEYLDKLKDVAPVVICWLPDDDNDIETYPDKPGLIIVNSNKEGLIGIILHFLVQYEILTKN